MERNAQTKKDKRIGWVSRGWVTITEFEYPLYLVEEKARKKNES